MPITLNACYFFVTHENTVYLFTSRMALAKEVITLAGLAKYFKDDTNCISKGDNKYKNDYVLEVKLVGMEINAVIRASMGDCSYKVKLTVDGTGEITNSSCECARGQWLCSHMAATAIYVNKTGVSKTDLPNSWITRPRKASKATSSIRVAEHFPKNNKQSTFVASSRPVEASDLRFLYTQLNDCSLKWMLGPEPLPTVKSNLEPVSIEEVLNIFISDKKKFLELCRVTCEQITWVANNTKDQRDSLLWGRLRRLRLTGSNFGKVLDAYERHLQKGTPYPESLFKSLKGEYRLEGKDSIMWGQMHEDNAISAYVALTNNRVEKIGLCLFDCGYLGSTPDGLVISTDDGNGVLEVKCPYKHREVMVDEMIKTELHNKLEKKYFFLKHDGSLNQKHSYWHQVQGEIYAAKVQWADFVIWTKKDLRVVRVAKDEAWIANIEKLCDFYINILLPKCYTSD